MSVGVLQQDGTKCYVGVGCRKHDHANVSETQLKVELDRKLAESESKTVETKNFLRRRHALLVIRNHGDSIVVANRGANAHVKPYVNLKDMQDGDVARGNCWAVTNELIEMVSPDDFNASWTDEVSITTGARGLNHTALLVGDRENIYVVDYTARQFDKSLPFPFIADVKSWKDTLSKVYGKKFEIVEGSDN